MNCALLSQIFLAACYSTRRKQARSHCGDERSLFEDCGISELGQLHLFRHWLPFPIKIGETAQFIQAIGGFQMVQPMFEPDKKHRKRKRHRAREQFSQTPIGYDAPDQQQDKQEHGNNINPERVGPAQFCIPPDILALAGDTTLRQAALTQVWGGVPVFQFVPLCLSRNPFLYSVFACETQPAVRASMKARRLLGGIIWTAFNCPLFSTR